MLNNKLFKTMLKKGQSMNPDRIDSDSDNDTTK